MQHETQQKLGKRWPHALEISDLQNDELMATF